MDRFQLVLSNIGLFSRRYEAPMWHIEKLCLGFSLEQLLDPSLDTGNGHLPAIFYNNPVADDPKLEDHGVCHLVNVGTSDRRLGRGG